MSDTIDLVRFRLQPGKTAQEWLQANEKINEWVARQPGFHFHSVSVTEDGEWLDLVYWESMEAALAAGEKFGTEMMPHCAPLIAPDSVVMSRSQAHVMQQG